MKGEPVDSPANLPKVRIQSWESGRPEQLELTGQRAGREKAT